MGNANLCGGTMGAFLKYKENLKFQCFLCKAPGALNFLRRFISLLLDRGLGQTAAKYKCEVYVKLRDIFSPP